MARDSIDADGFRANVGIIICNADDKLLWARRVGQGGWQFPQGGILKNESPLQAMYRELREEVGLEPDDVEIIATTSGWNKYHLPPRYQRKNAKPRCVGQKQRWFMLRLLADEDRISFEHNEPAEFDAFKWVDSTHPVEEVIFFKRDVYAEVLRELLPKLATPDSLSSSGP